MREKLAEALGLGCIYRETGRFSRGRAVRSRSYQEDGMAKAVRGPVGRGRSHPGSALSRAQVKTGGAGEPGSLGGKRGERENGDSWSAAYLDAAAGPRQSATWSQSRAAETTRAPQSLVRSPGRDPAPLRKPAHWGGSRLQISVSVSLFLAPHAQTRLPFRKAH